MNVETFNKDKAISNILERQIVAIDFMNFICGDLLGLGSSRYVFVYKPDPRYVIKIDLSSGNQNVLEWDVWRSVSMTRLAKWFAPCKEISECGRILIQRRCKTGIAYSEYPKKVPVMFTDLKYQNWGKLNGNMVCFDYALHMLHEHGINAKLRVTKWWSATSV